MKIPLTKKGLEKLEKRLFEFNKKMPEISNKIAEARALGDLSENAEYHAAREEQGILEAKIENLESIIASAEIIIPSKVSDKNKIAFGATVELLNENINKKVTYTIVGEPEADVDNGLISIQTPLAKEMIGKEVGDYIDLQIGNKEFSYKILEVKYID